MDPNEAFQQAIGTLEAFIDVFESERDVAVLKRIGNRQSRLRETRMANAKRMEDLLEHERNELALLEKSVGELDASNSRLKKSKEITSLDSQKFSAVKEINELENAVNAAELQLQQLRNELIELETEDPTTIALEHMDEKHISKLNYYRQMGIITDSQDDPTKITKIMVKSSRPEKGNIINSLNLTSNNGYGEKFVSDFVWENI